MSPQTISFETTEEAIQKIDRIVGDKQTSRAEVLSDAIEAYLADYDELQADLEEADRQIEAGEYVTHEEVVANFEKRFANLKAA